MALPAIAATVGKKVAKKAVKAGGEKVKKKAKMKVSKVSDMVNEKVQDKLGVEDGKIKKRRGRPKKFQTLAEVEADINLRELKKAQAKLKKEKEIKIPEIPHFLRNLQPCTRRAPLGIGAREKRR